MLARLLCSAALAAAIATSAAAPAAADTTTPVTFAAGMSGTAVSGTVAGADSTNFTLTARQGQRLSVRLTSDNSATSFNIFKPGDVPGQAQPIFASAQQGGQADLVLPETGTYVLQTYLQPGATTTAARFSLTIDIDGEAQAQPNPAQPPDAAAQTQDAATATAAATPAADGGPDYWQVAGVTGGLNLRAEAGTTAAVVTRLNSGARLRNLGCQTVADRNWCKVETVETPARQGWVAGEYLKEAGAPDSAAAPTATSPVAPAESAAQATTGSATQPASSARPPAAPASKPVPGQKPAAAPAPSPAPEPEAPPQKPARAEAEAPAPAPAPAPAASSGTATATDKGTLPCSTVLGMPTRDCGFAVTRSGGGNAVVTIIRPDGSTRDIRFDAGTPQPRDGQTTERRGALTVINIGDERYEVLDSVINGG